MFLAQRDQGVVRSRERDGPRLFGERGVESVEGREAQAASKGRFRQLTSRYTIDDIGIDHIAEERPLTPRTEGRQ